MSAATTALLVLAHHDLAAAREAASSPVGLDFPHVLAAAATLVVAVCALWCWSVTTAATLEALRGVRQAALPGPRGAVRRLVLAGCGVALAATVAPAQADDLGAVAGEPPQPVAARAILGDAPSRHTVRAGESLWAISAARLGPGASDAAISGAWHATWRANEETIGSDPDVIEPGQRLDLPELTR
ncbi:LysM peptidoglycan-binding domain-containing protein [Nocardioides jiangxiensis]|uniref:LysM peptidoglycan-binding domain-containing protein n=1 Tax=Nocardioides jiangxiensis TaxID=3064524 RepID=A0ABT9AZL2_9ACTN|nr:LysM peptidoglycan-binding domain-containing protein [Nocardioides sp. WY-20]MDO7867464.1 LysM peptidoglycan-binding domain-containing protein [Nocardioides sp. WY-20]